MSEDVKLSSAVIPEPTDVRFSTRSLLVMMAVTAVAATALGAFLRQFPAEAQARLWIWWGALVAIMFLVAGIFATLRFRAERKAGRVLFRLVPHSYFFPRAPRLATILVGSLLLASAPGMWVFGSFVLAAPDARWWTQLLNWGTFYTLFASGLGLTYFWWHARIRLAENGVVVRHEFVPWENVQMCYWDACYPNVVVMWFEFHRKISALVRAEERKTMSELLEEKLGDRAPSKS
jgi:hypothetical protein